MRAAAFACAIARGIRRVVGVRGRAGVRRFAALAACLASASVAAAQQTHLLVVGGIGGDPAYSEAFHGWASTLVDAAEAGGVPRESVIWLAEDPARDPARIDGKSTRQNVVRTVTELAQRVEPGDQVLVVLIGHGSHRNDESRFNLPGPDITAGDVAVALDAFGSRRVAVVNAASASGAFVPALSGENRVVVTATRSPREANATRFGRYFAEAWADGAADTDKDGRVSLLEAFDYARLETARSYEEDDQLLTEHALLDDDGDGAGVEEPGADGEGALAAGFFLSPDPGAVAAADDPELRRLYGEKAALEERIAQLRGRKDEMEPAAYDAALEELLVELALTSREIRRLEQPPDRDREREDSRRSRVPRRTRGTWSESGFGPAAAAMARLGAFAAGRTAGDFPGAPTGRRTTLHAPSPAVTGGGTP